MQIGRTGECQLNERCLRRAACAALRSSLLQTLGWWLACAERLRQRRALARLDARLLSDIGITRCDAEREIEKPFWR